MSTVQSNTGRSSGFRDWAYFVPFCVALLAVLLGIGRPRPKNPPETLDIDKLPPELRRLTAPQLAAASGKFVKPEQITWLIIGDLRKIEAGVRGLGWGAVTVLDTDGKPVAR